MKVIQSKSHELKYNLKVLNLSKNVGHQNALWAGLAQADPNAYVVAMDCDLQDPPSHLIDFLKSFEEKYDVVLTQRLSRQDKFLKRLTALIFYKILAYLSSESLQLNSGDFFGMSPVARKRLLTYGESSKYIRGLIQCISDNVKILKFHRNSRDQGETKYTFSKMLKLAISGITGFTIRPLILGVYIAVGGFVVGCVAGIFLLVSRLRNPHLYPAGYAFSNLTLIILSILILLILSILSVYLSMIVIEIKKRPNYFVEFEKIISSGDSGAV
jgi:dolichol-phosphate mannosyltransferase